MLYLLYSMSRKKCHSNYFWKYTKTTFSIAQILLIFGLNTCEFYVNSLTHHCTTANIYFVVLVYLVYSEMVRVTLFSGHTVCVSSIQTQSCLSSEEDSNSTLGEHELSERHVHNKWDKIEYVWVRCLKAFSRGRSEHTDRNVEFPNRFFSETHNSREIIKLLKLKCWINLFRVWWVRTLCNVDLTRGQVESNFINVNSTLINTFWMNKEKFTRAGFEPTNWWAN